MRTLTTVPKIRQLDMPGMPQPTRIGGSVGPRSVAAGQPVMYLGDLRGGPRRGARGTVMSLRPKSALVDMGAHGRWNVPYFLLALQEAA